METNWKERERVRYLLKGMSGGRNAFARTVDYIFLRLILFLGAYLFFASQGFERKRSLLLGVVFLGLSMALLRILREIRLERFEKKEMERVRALLMSDRLLLLPKEKATALTAALARPGEQTVLLQKAAPAGADDMAALLRDNPSKQPIRIYACSGFDDSAKRIALRLEDRLILGNWAELQKTAKGLDFSPTRQEVDNYLAWEARRRNKRRKIDLSGLLSRGPGKYALTSFLLTLISFFTRYTLYYRLLAGLCMSAAALSILGERRHHEKPS